MSDFNCRHCETVETCKKTQSLFQGVCPDFKINLKEKKAKFKEQIKLPDIPHEAIDPTPITIQEVIKGFKKNVHIDEDINITLPIGYTVSSFAPCDADVLGIIAPSGSGKTEVIRGLGDTENQYIVPISSLTSHTFVSGLKDSRDLAPQLRGRMITIKDFTTILSKNKDEVSGIFADIRDITDGYIQKTYGSEVSKKEYRGLHTSVLFACTNAIEKFYSINSILGQRMLYFRPENNGVEARKKALQNAGKEKQIREEHHALMMRLINTILITKKDRIDQLTQNVSGDMQERIGQLCDFLAIVRTHIDRDMKGNMASIPEPELPTRLTKTLCKIVDAHSILYDRLPTYSDEGVAVRLIRDNIPTERCQILKVLSYFKEYKTTSEISTAAKLPTSMTSRVLNDLASLDIIERIDRTSAGTNSDQWLLPESTFKNAFLVASHYKMLLVDDEMLRGVIRQGEYVDLYSYVYQNNNTIIKEEVNKAFHTYLSESHPSTFQEAQKESLEEKIKESCKYWENLNRKSINSSNLIEFVLWYCEQNKNGNSPSEIRKIAEQVFKITPTTQDTAEKITVEDNGEVFEVVLVSCQTSRVG